MKKKEKNKINFKGKYPKLINKTSKDKNYKMKYNV